MFGYIAVVILPKEKHGNVHMVTFRGVRRNLFDHFMEGVSALSTLTIEPEAVTLRFLTRERG